MWVAPPEVTEELTTHIVSHQLTNTSAIDVFHEKLHPDIVKKAMTVVLEPGDLLYIPPKWWHALRSEDPSISVSMWF